MVAARRSSQLIVLSGEPEPRRPRTRADCERGPRPCPWISCRHHVVDVAEAARATTVLGLDLPTRATREAEAAWVDEVSDAVLSLTDSCTLDLAERDGGRGREDGMTLDEIGEVFGVTRERVRQIESQGLRTVRDGRRSGVLRELLPPK